MVLANLQRAFTPPFAIWRWFGHKESRLENSGQEGKNPSPPWGSFGWSNKIAQRD